MATKKKSADPQKQMLITATKKTVQNNAVIAILEDILFVPGFAIVTDLETFVKVPYAMEGVPEGGICLPAKKFLEILDMVEKPSVVVREGRLVDLVEGTRVIKLTGDKAEDYPRTASTEGFKKAATFGPQQLADIKTALNFVSNDDLRPAMTGIFFHDHIAATDAHRLFWKPITPLEQEFILPSRSAGIILAMGGDNWEVYTDANHTRWVNESGVEVISRSINARFPDYKVVLPDEKEMAAKVFVIPDILMKELKNASKFANKSTKQVKFTLNGKITMRSEDIDFGWEYENVLGGVEFGFDKKYKQYLVPADNDYEERRVIISGKAKEVGKVRVAPVNCGGDAFEVAKEVLQPTDPIMSIAFNGDFLTEILQRVPTDAATEIKLWGPTKAAVINSHFLVMPLMIG